MIKTKSIYEQVSDDDGIRVLVMRYWPRGVRKEASDIWMKALGPSAGLIRVWKDESIDWAEFRRRYLAEFDSDAEKSAALSGLKKLVKQEKGRAVTLLCSCKGESCHRFLIQEMLKARR